MTQKPKDGIYKNTFDHEQVSKSDFVVDLRSDTMTKPNDAMRKAIASAEVGDDVQSEDPTVKKLEEKMCELLGKEAAVFVPSGTMGNLISVLVHCQGRGQEAIVGDQAHMFLYEQGGMAQFGGVQANIIKNEPDGTFSIEGVLKKIRMDDQHYPRTKLICVENTHNMCGGRVLPLEWIDQICKVGKDYDIPVHLDGARIFSASVACKIPVPRIVQGFSSVSVCLSKNVGAPVGSVLLGNSAFIKEARRMRKALGGGMRQCGILAAAGLYAIEYIIPKLHQDHENAQLIGQAVHNLSSPCLSVHIDNIQSNFFLLNTHGVSAQEFCDRLAYIDGSIEQKNLGNSISVLAWPRNESTLRCVVHCDITKTMAEKAAEKICYVAQEFAKKLNLK